MQRKNKSLPIRSTKLKFIHEIFRNQKFRLFKGQREYVWDRQRWEELWDDLLRTSKENTFHFFGPMFFIPEELENKNNTIFILDGHQRIATISILLAVIRDLCDLGRVVLSPLPRKIATVLTKCDEFLFSDEKEKAPRLSLGEKSIEIYSSILSYPEDSSIDKKINSFQIKEKNKSSKLLSQCYKFFFSEICKKFGYEPSFRKLKNTPNDEKIKEFINNSKFIEFLINLYETITKKFFVLKIVVPDYFVGYEIFETLNQRLTPLTPDWIFKNFIYRKLKKDYSEEKINRYWKNIIEAVGIDTFRKFLRHYWISKFEHVSERNLFRSIREYCEPMDNKQFTKLLSEMQEEGEIYSALRNATHEYWKNHPEISKTIEEMKYLGFTQFLPLLVVAYKKLIFSAKKSNVRFKKLITLFLNFSVRAYTILDRNPNEFEKMYSQWTRKLRNCNKNQEVYKVLKEIEDFIKDEWPEDKEIKEKVIGMKCKEKTAKYILIKINDSLLKGKEKESLIITSLAHSTLEHIIPKKLDEKWIKLLKKEGIKVKNYINRLGNLTILPPSPNKKLGNKPFKEKLYEYLNTNIPLNKVTFKGIKRFKREIIEKREKIMAEIIEKNKLWSFPK